MDAIPIDIALAGIAAAATVVGLFLRPSAKVVVRVVHEPPNDLPQKEEVEKAPPVTRRGNDASD